jgi:hypothetical protein
MKASFQFEQLRLQVDTLGEAVHIVWLGCSDMRNPAEAIEPFLKGLVPKFPYKKVVLDFSKFEYMNSATVSPIMAFVRLLDSQSFTTTLRYDIKVDWQRVNCNCMKAISRTLKHVSVLES